MKVAFSFPHLLRSAGLLLAGVGSVLPWLGANPTYCQLRLRQLENGPIQWQACDDHLCTDEDANGGYSPCQDDYYIIDGHTYRKCQCPSPSYTNGPCLLLLIDEATAEAHYECYKMTCDDECSKQGLDANYLPRCICP